MDLSVATERRNVNEGAKEQTIDTLIAQLPDLKQLTRRPFPHHDCFGLIEDVGEAVSDLIPCLDLYFSTIAGYSSSAQRILLWPDERKRAARHDLARGFYEQYPEFRILQPMITHDSVPDLFDEYWLHEYARETLLTVLLMLD